MKIQILYNEFRSIVGGEDKIVGDMISILGKNGVEVSLEKRSSKNLNFFDKSKAFFGGIFNFPEYFFMLDLLENNHPDIVHVHNLYPFFSPSVLVACRRAGVPVVMTLHNFGLTCPHWSHFRKGQTCEKCADGNVLWCVVKNCQGNPAESIGYALRSDVARRFGLFRKNVNTFIALTEFAKKRLVTAGYPSKRIVVFPNPVDKPASQADVRNGGYVAFAGRISEEKGVQCLLAAAQRLPNVPFEVAGDGPLLPLLKTEAPDNVAFHGVLNATDLARFFQNARLLVVPSECFEMCPTVLLEGMAMALPVVVSRTGGLPEFVADGESGLLFERGDSEDLAAKIRELWYDAELAMKLGRAARQWTELECSESIYFDRLMGVYLGVLERKARDRMR